jgi:hypothetical protein
MSIVGPRPSPESENTLCPSWRDARLSVRPGITGLWQVYRTREPFKDFQEWIHYDTKYAGTLTANGFVGVLVHIPQDGGQLHPSVLTVRVAVAALRRSYPAAWATDGGA